MSLKFYNYSFRHDKNVSFYVYIIYLFFNDKVRKILIDPWENGHPKASTFERFLFSECAMCRHTSSVCMVHHHGS